MVGPLDQRGALEVLRVEADDAAQPARAAAYENAAVAVFRERRDGIELDAPELVQLQWLGAGPVARQAARGPDPRVAVRGREQREHVGPGGSVGGDVEALPSGVATAQNVDSVPTPNGQVARGEEAHRVRRFELGRRRERTAPLTVRMPNDELVTSQDGQHFTALVRVDGDDRVARGVLDEPLPRLGHRPDPRSVGGQQDRDEVRIARRLGECSGDDPVSRDRDPRQYPVHVDDGVLEDDEWRGDSVGVEADDRARGDLAAELSGLELERASGGLDGDTSVVVLAQEDEQAAVAAIAEPLAAGPLRERRASDAWRNR